MSRGQIPETSSDHVDIFKCNFNVIFLAAFLIELWKLIYVPAVESLTFLFYSILEATIYVLH